MGQERAPWTCEKQQEAETRSMGKLLHMYLCCTRWHWVLPEAVGWICCAYSSLHVAISGSVPVILGEGQDCQVAFCVLGPALWTVARLWKLELSIHQLGSPVAVVVIVVVTPQSGQAAQADSIGEKDLRSSVHPHLEEGTEMWALRESDVGGGRVQWGGRSLLTGHPLPPKTL